MLQELRVSNFAIIDHIEMNFKSGLNILSGETGAGKSVLLKSLSLLMGQKASSETVKSNCKKATIEGLFDISKRLDIKKALSFFEIPTDDESLIVRRVICAQGKSKVYLNGTLVSLQQMRDIVSPLIELTGQNTPLIEMTGQHDNRNLQTKSYHLELLDQYTGSLEKRQKYQAVYEERIKLMAQLDQLKHEAQFQEQKLDYLLFQKNEIESVKLEPGDETNLEFEVKKLKNHKKLFDLLQTTNNNLYLDEDSALNRIGKSIKLMESAADFDPTITEKAQGLIQAKALIEDSLFELEKHISQTDSEPDTLLDLEERLSHLRKLQKKFGPTVEDIFTQLDEIKVEVDKIENFDLHIKSLEKGIDKLSQKLKDLSEELHVRRVNGASLLTKGVHDELIDLNMKGLTVEVQVKKLDDLTSTGISDVEFLTQTSKSDKPRPLAKFASGGELSRILLSLKRIVGISKYPRTYLFDEVDTGVSGETAQKVGRKLKSIAVGGQVICVTHLPQVASYADAHFLIQKVPTKDTVEMNVIELNKKKQVDEVARLISGEEITKTSLAHAKQLIQQSTL